jgi:IS5 family transposase
VFADKGYVNEKKKRAARAAGVCWAVKEQRKPGRQLSSSQKKRNRRHGSVRAKVEHVFRVLKCQFGYRKVAIAASPKTVPRCSRCWHSPTSISVADS